MVELLVVVAIFIVVFGFLLPAISRSREQARRTTCMHNLKQVGAACHMYATDWAEKFPFPPSGSNVAVCRLLVLRGYTSQGGIFTCPSSHDIAKSVTQGVDPTTFAANNVSFYYNSCGTGLVESDLNTSPLWADQWVVASNAWTSASNHWTDGGNICYVDGHVSWQAGSTWPSTVHRFWTD